jgi:hypothetical protein
MFHSGQFGRPCYALHLPIFWFWHFGRVTAVILPKKLGHTVGSEQALLLGATNKAEYGCLLSKQSLLRRFFIWFRIFADVWNFPHPPISTRLA